MTDTLNLLNFALRTLDQPCLATFSQAPDRPAPTLAEAAGDKVPKSGDVTVEVTGLGEDDLQIVFVLVGDKASGTPRLCRQQQLLYGMTQSPEAQETFSNDSLGALAKTQSFQAYYFLRQQDDHWLAAPASPVYHFTQG